MCAYVKEVRNRWNEISELEYISGLVSVEHFNVLYLLDTE